LPDAASLLLLRKDRPGRLGQPALQGQSVLPDLKGRKDRKDLSERRVHQATGARPVRLAPKDKSVPKARKANRGRKGQQVLPALVANPGRKAPPDRRAPRVLPELEQIPVPRRRFVSSRGQVR